MSIIDIFTGFGQKVENVRKKPPPKGGGGPLRAFGAALDKKKKCPLGIWAFRQNFGVVRFANFLVGI